MDLHLESSGRRIYVVGPTYSLSDRLRSAGCRWDPERRAWWAGMAKRTELEQLVEAQAGAAAAAPKKEAPGEGATVAGRAEYKGRTYYLAGRTSRGRTRWDDTVEPVSTRDGSRLLLYFRDGSSQFWAHADQVRILRTYDRPQTIRSLKRYADEARQARRQGYEDGIPEGRRYECDECGEYVVRGDGSRCWETGCTH